ncbi:PucR family transcriptional regulator [Streptomyces sp. BH097]|uniref:PucR family transcriptional regulator n=1 Tax=unclassified Streptomyces TaxID=2593676 RepID=UPI003BB58A68
MSTTGRLPDVLTVAELVHHGPLARHTMLGTAALDVPVRHVTLVTDLDQTRGCRPGTALVLHTAAAQGGWALESALRTAWERGAACVLAPRDTGVGRSTVDLADRLNVPLFALADDPARHALDLAAAVAAPGAARGQLAARCATAIGEQTSLRGIVGVINAELPGTAVALMAEDGRVLTGRAAAVGGQVDVAVPGVDGKPWARLVARLSAEATEQETVTTVLRLARAPLAASAAKALLATARRSARERLLLETLTSGVPDVDTRRAAAELGWDFDASNTVVFLRPAAGAPSVDPDTATAGTTAGWYEAFGQRPLIPYGGGWVGWWNGPKDTASRVAALIRARLPRIRSALPLSAGVGEPGRGVEGLRRSLHEAQLAAAVAARSGAGDVERYGVLGPRVVLAGLPNEELAPAARTALAALLSAADGDTLVRTLCAVLDCGGSTGQAAARLGVHRNTVSGRLERVRAKGITYDDPDLRFALHVACFVLLGEPAVVPPDESPGGTT